MKTKILVSLLLVIIAPTSIRAQSIIEITINPPSANPLTPFDSTWNADGIQCELETGWIEPINSIDGGEDYYIFGGDSLEGFFRMLLGNFPYKIDSIHFDVFDACNLCFAVTAYYANGNIVEIEDQSIDDTNEDTLYFENFSSQNPDSIIMKTYEGGFRKITVYHSNEALNVNDTIENPNLFTIQNNELTIPHRFQNENYNLYLHDLTGKTVASHSLENKPTVSISDVKSGIYIVSVVSSGKLKEVIQFNKIFITHSN
jgi:hypothetical protein